MSDTQIHASEQLLREAAYLIWEKAGRPNGQADLHWEMAKELSKKTFAPSLELPPAKSRSGKKNITASTTEIGARRKRAPARVGGDTAVYQ